MPESPYLVGDLPGYTPAVARLVSIINYARLTTVMTVADLKTPALDYMLDVRANSIGMLLAHIAYCEFAMQIETFERRQLTAEEKYKFAPALDLGELGQIEFRGKDLGFYLDLLNAARRKTLDLFKTVDDAWLETRVPLWGSIGNFHFMWFHVGEDEIHHRGQMALIRKRLPK
ncbi:hypothetical protein PLCT2_01775 [Planctomycetaceae bacterium]|nr:hypothetical protein PLCT2_01775 [Planctomycetaceae bacterium]